LRKIKRRFYKKSLIQKSLQKLKTYIMKIWKKKVFYGKIKFKKNWKIF